MDASERLYQALVEDFGMEGATGSVRFNLRDFGITVEQNNIVGNILEEWAQGEFSVDSPRATNQIS